MSNTLNANLIRLRVAAVAIQLAPAVLAPFKAFSSNYSLDTAGPTRPVAIPDVTAVPETEVDPTDFFGAADSTVGAVSPTGHHYHQRFHIGYGEGVSIETLAASAFVKFSQKLNQVLLAPLTEANFPTEPIRCAPAGFGGGEIKAAMAAVRTPRRSLLLDTVPYSCLVPDKLQPAGSWGLPGFTNGVHEISDWGAAGPGIIGAVCDPAALVVTSGLPIQPIKRLIETSSVVLPGLDLVVQFNAFGQIDTRAVWGSFDVYLGVMPGKTDKLTLIKSL